MLPPQGKLTATLSDQSSTDYSGFVDSPSGNRYAMADLTFAALSAGQTMTVKYVVDTSYSPAGDGNITLHAATLAPAVPSLWQVSTIKSVAATDPKYPKCVDVTQADNRDANRLQIYSCNSTGAQSWLFHPDRSVQSLGKCMDVRQGATADGPPVQLYTCNNTAAQSWTYDAATQRLQAFGKCLDATAGGITDGALLVLNTCSTATSQRWALPS